MEFRKVQLTGGTSLTVTLPKAWVEKVDLQAGDVVGCTEQPDGNLSVAPHAKDDRELRTFEIVVESQNGEALFRKVIAAYLNGYDAIKVTSAEGLSPQARQAVQRAKTRVMGLEVIEEGVDSITVQDFLDPKEFHIDKALRRMQMLTQTIQQEADGLLKNPEQTKVEAVEERDDEVDRLFWLVNKQFQALLRDGSYASKMQLTPSQAQNFLLVARLCERTADHANRVAKEAVAIPRTNEREAFLDDLASTWRSSTSLFEESVDAFRSQEIDEANRVIERAHGVEDEQVRHMKRSTDFGPEAVAHLAFIIESIGRTAAYAANIAEIAINHSLATPQTRSKG